MNPNTNVSQILNSNSSNVNDDGINSLMGIRSNTNHNHNHNIINNIKNN
jgi:hypothetical protein